MRDRNSNQNPAEQRAESTSPSTWNRFTGFFKRRSSSASSSSSGSSEPDGEISPIIRQNVSPTTVGTEVSRKQQPSPTAMTQQPPVIVDTNRSRDETKDEARGRIRSRGLNGRDLARIRSRSRSRSKSRVRFMDDPDIIVVPQIRAKYRQQHDTEIQYFVDCSFTESQAVREAQDRAESDLNGIMTNLPAVSVIEKIIRDAFIMHGIVYAGHALHMVSKALRAQYVAQVEAYNAGKRKTLPENLPEIFQLHGQQHRHHVYLSKLINHKALLKCKQLLLKSGANRLRNVLSEMEKILGVPYRQYAFRLVLWMEEKYYRAKQQVMLIDPRPLTLPQQAKANAYAVQLLEERADANEMFAQVLHNDGYDVCREVVAQYYSQASHVRVPSYNDGLFSHVAVSRPVIDIFKQQIVLDHETSAVISHDLSSWLILAKSKQAGFATLLAAVSERRRLALDAQPVQKVINEQAESRAVTPSSTPMPAHVLSAENSLSKHDGEPEAKIFGVIANSESEFSRAMRKVRQSLRRRNERAIRTLAAYNDLRGSSLIQEKKPPLRIMLQEANVNSVNKQNNYHVMRNAKQVRAPGYNTVGGIIKNAANFYPLIINCLKVRGSGLISSLYERGRLSELLLKQPRNFTLKFVATDVSGQTTEEWQLLDGGTEQVVYTVDAIELQNNNCVGESHDMLEVITTRQLTFHSLLSRTFDISGRSERPVMQAIPVEHQLTRGEAKLAGYGDQGISVAAIRAAFMSLVTNKDPTRISRIFSGFNAGDQLRTYLALDESSDDDKRILRSFALRIGGELFNQELFGVAESLAQLESYFNTELTLAPTDSEEQWLRVLGLQYVFYDLSKVIEMQLRRRVRFIETVNAANHPIEQGKYPLDWAEVDGILQIDHPLALPGVDGVIDERSDLFDATTETIAKMNLIRENMQRLAMQPFKHSNNALHTITGLRYQELYIAMGNTIGVAEEQVRNIKARLGYTPRTHKKTWQQLKDARQQGYIKQVGRKRSSAVGATNAKIAAPAVLKKCDFNKLTIEKFRTLKATIINQRSELRSLFESAAYCQLEQRLMQLVSEYQSFNCRNKADVTIADIARDNYVTLGMKKVEMIYTALETISSASLSLSACLQQLHDIDGREYDVTLMNAEGRLVELSGFHFSRHRHGDRQDINGTTIPIRSLRSVTRLFGSKCCGCISTATQKPLAKFVAEFKQNLNATVETPIMVVS
ncbi:MAG: hypothetical protein P1U63_02165 [Coxiellaceae bacterium]|nr:hypothetical protein [Coxiellaceae bacterium]